MMAELNVQQPQAPVEPKKELSINVTQVGS